MLFKTTFLENWGSGARRIIDACKQQNVAEPKWETQGDFVIVTLKRVMKNSNKESVEACHDPNMTQVRPKYDPSTTQVIILINAMTDDFMSIKDMMQLCCLNSRKRFRENYVTPALEDEAIERKFPNQPNHPHQQYRLTEKAKEWRGTNKE